MQPLDLAPLEGLVPPSLLSVAARIGRPVAFAAGERIFRAGMPVRGIHFIVSGAVRIVREGKGRAVVVHREARGGLLGEVAFFGGGVYPGTAVAVEPARMLLLPAAPLRAIIATDAEVAGIFLRRLALRTRGIIERLDGLAHQTVLRRLAAHLASRREATGERPGSVSLGMTLVDLAEELGTVKEVVVRELRTLRRLRLIEPAGRGLYRIVDPVGLRGLS